MRRFSPFSLFVISFEIQFQEKKKVRRLAPLEIPSGTNRHFAWNAPCSILNVVCTSLKARETAREFPSETAGTSSIISDLAGIS